jgi:hypothetical protein
MNHYILFHQKHSSVYRIWYHLMVIGFAVFFVFLISSCARPCPADENLGNINLSSSTLSFLPFSQKTNKMTFVNSDGETLEFTNNGQGENRFDLAVETLCERGDFLDKTVQTAEFKVQSFHYSYYSTNTDYNLNIDMTVNNAGSYGNRTDTVFYETIAVWGQRFVAPAQTGSWYLIADERGNSANITDTFRTNANHYRFVADTTLIGRHITNAYVGQNDGKNTFYIFYSKQNGIEAFTTEDGNEVWVRD